MAGGGGAWKVAYADFVTAMMAFFMVMWLTAQKPEVKTAVAEHFRNPGGKQIAGNDSRSVVPSSNTGNGNRRVTKARGTKKSEGDDKFRKMTDEGDKSNIGSVVPFDVNSVALNEQGREAILNLLPELEGKLHRLEVRGHAASNGGESTQAAIDAWNISYKRSLSVTQFLIESGIDPRRIRPSAAGNSEPKYQADEKEEPNDSRVEVYVLTEIFEEPSEKKTRLTSTKALDQQATETAAAAAAAAAAVPAKGGH